MEEKDMEMNQEEENLNQETDKTAEETEVTAEADKTEEGKEDSEEAAKEPTLEEQIEIYKDKYIRSVAEFDNYRKRTLKEKAELILNGSEKTITAILPVLDDMELAIKNGEKTDDPKVLKEGMELIYHKFMKTLSGLGVNQIETADADFNTDEHEAVAMVPGMGDDKKGKVIDCIQTGYKLNDKVIRHAKVAVGQ
jgi:molecular chaperone GrpE